MNNAKFYGIDGGRVEKDFKKTKPGKLYFFTGMGGKHWICKLGFHKWVIGTRSILVRKIVIGYICDRAFCNAAREDITWTR